MSRAAIVACFCLALPVWLCAAPAAEEDDVAKQKTPGFVRPAKQATLAPTLGPTVRPTVKPTATPNHLKRELKEVKKELAESRGALAEEVKARQGLSGELGELRSALGQQGEAVEALAVSLQGARDELSEIARDVEKGAVAGSERAKSLEDMRMNLDSLGKLLGSIEERMKALEKQMAKVEEGRKQSEEAGSKMEDLLELMRGDISNNDEDIAALRKKVQQLSFDESKRAGNRQNIDRLKALVTHPLTALGMAVVALVVAIAR